MNKDRKKTVKYGTGLTLGAAALIFVGIVVVLTTFLTIVGPIFGLILIIAGVYMLTLASQAKSRRLETTEDKQATPAKAAESRTLAESPPVEEPPAVQEKRGRDTYAGEARPRASSRRQTRQPANDSRRGR